MAWGLCARLVGLLCGVVLALAPVPSWGQQRLRGVALVIGQSDYESIADLPNAERDADAIETLLSDLGFTSSAVTDRDARRLTRDLDAFLDDAEGADVAVIYYGGHAVEIGGENYLVPTDADVSSPKALAGSLISLSEQVSSLQTKANVTIVLLDACRDNPFPAGTTIIRPGDDAPVVVTSTGLQSRGVVAMTHASAAKAGGLGVVVGFAAEPGKAALDGEPGTNSPYAAALLRHIGAMAGEELGTVMRMVAQEVYLKTGGKQRPWVNESLQRLLYFGRAPDPIPGEQGEILKERRALLLTIAALPDIERRQVETAATDAGVPMDALYGMLKALGGDAPKDPTQLDKLLREQTDRLKAILSERAALQTADPEIQRLAGLADQAVMDGALDANLRFREAAKARYAAVSQQFDATEAALKSRRLEGGRIFAETAEAYELQRGFSAAAENYEQAFRQVQIWDRNLAWTYKTKSAAALGAQGFWHVDQAALQGAVLEFEQAFGFAPRETDPRRWATTQVQYGDALVTLGQRESVLDRAKGGRVHLARAVNAYRLSLEETDREDDPISWASIQASLARALSFLGEANHDETMLKESVRRYYLALEHITLTSDPSTWGLIQSDLGSALSALGRRERNADRLAEAVKAYDQGLKVVNREIDPMEWASRLTFLGRSIIELGTYERRSDLIVFGKRQIETAWSIYKAEGHLNWEGFFASIIRSADASLDQIQAYNSDQKN